MTSVVSVPCVWPATANSDGAGGSECASEGGGGHGSEGAGTAGSGPASSSQQTTSRRASGHEGWDPYEWEQGSNPWW